MNSTKQCWNQRRKTLGVCAAAMLMIMMMSLPVFAHKVNVFAYVEGEKVIVEGYFSGNVKAQDCSVLVFDESGKKIHEGKTDKEGLYSFKLADLPAFSGSLRIVLEAGMGHKAEYTLRASDLPGSDRKAAPTEKKSDKNTSEQPTVTSTASGPAQVMDLAAMTTALEKVLDKKLAPITRMLGKQEKLLLEQKFGGPKMSDIIGGLGWIIGMMGCAVFFWGRNRSTKK